MSEPTFSSVEGTRSTFVASGKFDAAKYQRALDRLGGTVNAFDEFSRMIGQARRALDDHVVVWMHPRTWRILKLDEKLRHRFPHLFRQFHPHRRSRSMKGK